MSRNFPGENVKISLHVNKRVPTFSFPHCTSNAGLWTRHTLHTRIDRPTFKIVILLTILTQINVYNSGNVRCRKFSYFSTVLLHFNYLIPSFTQAVEYALEIFRTWSRDNNACKAKPTAETTKFASSAKAVSLRDRTGHFFWP